MWKWTERAFRLVAIALFGGAPVLTCAGLQAPGRFLSDELPVILWVAGAGVLTVWVAATAGRLIVRRHAQPRHADSPEADYHERLD
jgi:hypothetical protein